MNSFPPFSHNFRVIIANTRLVALKLQHLFYKKIKILTTVVAVRFTLFILLSAESSGIKKQVKLMGRYQLSTQTYSP